MHRLLRPRAALYATFLTLSLAAAASPAPAQQFNLGDLYIYSTSAQETATPIPFAGILRVDGISAATSVFYKPASGVTVVSNIAYDPVRDRVLISEVGGGPPAGISMFESNGTKTHFMVGPGPFGFGPNVLAPSTNGNIYCVRYTGGGPTPYAFHYVDLANVTHDLIDASTAQLFALSVQPKFMVHDPITNSLIVTSFENTNFCGGNSTAATVIRRIPLSPDGTQVSGTIQQATICVAGEPYVSPVGLSRGAGNLISVVMFGSLNIHSIVRSFDPATMTIGAGPTIPGGIADLMVNSTGTYSHLYNKTAFVDTFKDRVRMLSPAGYPAGLSTFVTENADPKVSSTGGSSEIVYICEVDHSGIGLLNYGNGVSGCAGPHVLTGNSAPKAGTSTFRFVCSNPPAFSLGLVLVGDVPNPAGFDYLNIGVPLFVDPFASTTLLGVNIYSNGIGDSVSDAVPLAPGLVGMNFFAQAVWLSNTCAIPPFNLSSSNGLALTIQ